MPEARVDVAQFLVLLPVVHRDVSIERESAFELPRAVAAREAAPATAELLGPGLLSYCNMLRRTRRLGLVSDGRHTVLECCCSCEDLCFVLYIFIYLIVERSILFIYSSISSRVISSPTLIRDLDLTASMVTYSSRMSYSERKSCKRLLTHSTICRYLSTYELVV